MKEQFQKWLVKEKGLTPGTANNYSSAIDKISVHFTEKTGNHINIYFITDQNRISELTHDYSQSGRFSDFGYHHNGRYRAAISRYAEFFLRRNHAGNTESNDPYSEGGLFENESVTQQSNFSYERDLQASLCAQISQLFPGYKIFGTSNEGVEFSIGSRKIDVLLEHVDSGNLLAVELKSGIADFKVFGQISMYLGLLQKEFPNKTISGVIVAGTIDESLRQACEITDKVELKTYRMSIELEDS